MRSKVKAVKCGEREEVICFILHGKGFLCILYVSCVFSPRFVRELSICAFVTVNIKRCVLTTMVVRSFVCGRIGRTNR